MKTKLEKAIYDSMTSNPNNWKGIFYKNSNDPRVLVKRVYNPKGWTLNWASPYSYISFSLLILITIVAFIFF